MQKGALGLLAASRGFEIGLPVARYQPSLRRLCLPRNDQNLEALVWMTSSTYISSHNTRALVDASPAPQPQTAHILDYRSENSCNGTVFSGLLSSGQGSSASARHRSSSDRRIAGTILQPLLCNISSKPPRLTSPQPISTTVNSRYVGGAALTSKPVGAQTPCVLGAA